ncbi:transmembrane protein [Thiobacillus denitrificans ATCC 25259]|uniref:Transmembrane protein n=1 Tax=Thiobacillus denitrificans (strain ATCC 25259 / T1) TaxID=292415 RepID=Q3SH60_THIDA|nr:YjgN family protein [Thiobacillus denitrificans]AAZ98029.1 transmembrane protein [Thiobacillus denitrificans ATCC 25259]
MSLTKQYPMQFTGTGREYFVIWIVNIALTLVTFGIYSAWAKVRTLRWFYGHTRLDDQVFSYLATPLQILRGRLIALAAIAAYYATSYFAPRLAIVLMLVFLVLLPWIIVNSLRFHARQSAYRGLRFDFTGSVGEAARIFIGLQLLIPFTLGLILPYVAYRQVRFIAGNTVYGQTGARYEGSHKPFWGVYLLSLGLILLPLAIIAFGAYQVYALRAAGIPPETAAAAAGSYLLAGMAVFYLMIPVIGALIQARTANLLYNGAALGPVGFASRQRARDLIWIYLSNLVLIALTLGLFIPWAKVRLARYRARSLTVNGPHDLGGFVAGQHQSSTATGSEMADLLDLNFGLT